MERKRRHGKAPVAGNMADGKGQQSSRLLLAGGLGGKEDQASKPPVEWSPSPIRAINLPRQTLLPMPQSATLSPGFMVVHANRLEDLRSLAVSWMQRYPLKPLENETILVQSNGIAQWLKLALAEDPRSAQAGEGQGCGIAAAVDVQLPARFLWQTYRAVLGRDTLPETSTLDRSGLTWRLMRLLPVLLDQPGFAPLQRFLADDRSMRKLHQLAERLADLFDQYQVYRADWLQQWADGHDTLRRSRREEETLAVEDRWQPALWRALLEDAGGGGMIQSRAGVHQLFVERMAQLDAPPKGLVRRVIVFGVSSMPAQALEALATLARFSQVLLCVHNPCQHHWTDIVADQDLLAHQYRRQQRKPGMPVQWDPSALHSHGHPLLAAWGKQGRDYIHLLDTHDVPERYQEQFAAVSDRRIDLFTEGDSDTLLSQLQDDILKLRSLDETREEWPPVDTAVDASISFHVAHSPQREVEILHDQLLARFGADPSLRPRDVIVMVPDINSYAPHIRAVFGQLDGSDNRHIPFTLADQGQRGQDPLLIAVEHLLKLPDSRFTVSEVLDLLDVPALRARFGMDESDLPLLHRWIEGAGVRWGLNAGQREALGLPGDLEQNTWHFGLRRMLLGYAVGDGGAFGEIEPYDEIGGLDAALIGPLDALISALARSRAILLEAVPPQQWGERLRQLLATFFQPENERDEGLIGRLEQLLENWLDTCESVALEADLPLVVVREAWLAELDSSRLNQRFLAGSVNFCTLMPMRAIPFKVVCLLGMNDGDYPRAQPPLDFDLMGRDYRPGDRSRREDDRYLLLEALLSARELLYVSWVGRSIRDNSERTPSVLVGQLRDHLASAWKLAGSEEDEAALLDALTVIHPLQPFSARYFLPDAGQAEGKYFSYAREWAAVYAAGSSQQASEQNLPPLSPEPSHLGLEQLQAFLRDPIKFFFTQRLKIFFDEAEQAPADEEPFALDGLQRYSLSEKLVQAALAESDPIEIEASLRRQALRLQRSGLLPLNGFGASQQDALIAPLPELLGRYHELLHGWPQTPLGPQALDMELDGIKLEGWLNGLRCQDNGQHLSLEIIPNELGLQSSKQLKWHRLTRPWVTHLLANAVGLNLDTVLLAIDGTLTLDAVNPDYARKVLSDLLGAWRQGLNEPLPLSVPCAFAWLSAMPDEDKAKSEARKTYEGSYNSAGEIVRNPYLARQYPNFDLLWANGAFSTWAQKLYDPLHEAVRESLAAAKVAKGKKA